MVRKSESVLSLSITGPVPPMGFQQSSGTMCTSGMMSLGCNPPEPPVQRPVSPMPPPAIKRVYMSPAFAEPPITATAGYERPMYYGQPCSPPPPAGLRTPSSGRQLPIRRRRDAYDGNDDDEGVRPNDYDDDDYAERSRRRRPPSLRRSRSAKDTSGAETMVTSTLSRSGSRIRMFRFEHDLSEAAPAGRPVGSRSRLEEGRCTCTCGAARSASRARMSGIRIRPRREEAEEMYVVKKRKSRRKKKHHPSSPPPPPPGIISYLRSLVGLNAEQPPAQKPGPTDSDSDDDNDYEVTKLDRAELERLCRQMNVKNAADDKDQK